jgi:Ca-activated chloride channel homolog
MTEPDLTRLKDVPTPRDAARRDALSAALSAFDEAAEKSASKTQGTLPPVRRRDASSRTEGRKPMRSFIHDNRALAASIAALMIAAPAAFTLYRQSTPVSAPRMEGGSALRADVAVPEIKTKAAGNAPASVAQIAPAAPMATRVPAPVGALAPQRQLAKKMEAARAAGAANIAMEAQIARPALREADSAFAPQEEFRDKFDRADVNPVKSTAQEPVSTFSIDVDTASYAFARRMINSGRLPQKDSVRVEEFINYFPYNYPKPDSIETPFRPTITVTPSPWNAKNRLVHVAVQGYALQSAERPRANLVFLIDVSGSMSSDDRLPLVKNALRLLVDELKPEDTVALVTYASGSGVALEPTKIADKGRILAAIDSLGAGGSTAGAQGIEDAYRLAEEHFDRNGVNRVILATDGDFNVGLTDQNALKGFIERKREKGVFLSILGVGQGNYNDALMQTLAQNGNGSAAYVDTLNEARKVLVEEASSTLFPIAKDVKIQVEWNPARVSEYRLIGYETRALKREDFNNDAVDAGDVGSGHRVTAIYEITPAGEKTLVDDLRYGKGAAKPAASSESPSELGFFKLRYKKPKEDESRLITTPIGDALAVEKLAAAPEDVRFSIAVAAFGQLLRGAPYVGRYGYDDVISLAQGARGDDPFGYRAEFVNLARLAKSARP